MSKGEFGISFLVSCALPLLCDLRIERIKFGALAGFAFWSSNLMSGY